MSLSQIIMMDPGIIDPHPDNPRKDLGDLTELTESIRTNGVLQNLTVVLHPDDPARYMAVIGHRRLAAAKAAGLAEVPVAVALMERTEQIQTMLCENLQRADLTPWEQAEGFQLMLDLGSSVKDIAKSTGFSESTVRHRVELAKLPAEKVMKKQAGGATLFDFIALEKIKDIKKREELLGSIGKQSFSWDLDRALQKQNVEAHRATAINAIEKFAVPFPEKENYWEYPRIAMYDLSDDKAPAIEPPETPGKYYWRLYMNDRLDIHSSEKRQDDSPPLSAEEVAKRKDFQDRIEKLKALDEKFKKRRLLFVSELKGKALEEKADALYKALLWALVEANGDFSIEVFKEISGDLVNFIKGEDGEEALGNKIASLVDGVWEGAWPGSLLLYTLYASFGSTIYVPYWTRTYDCTIDPPEEAEKHEPYDFLSFFGYELDEEEARWLDGTHELYTPAPESKSKAKKEAKAK